MANPSYEKLAASLDTYIVSAQPTTNFGTATTIAVSSGIVGLIEFDLSGIQSDATINEAVMSLYTVAAGGSGVHNVHRLVRNWVETEATWNEAETGTNWGTAGAANTTTDYNSTLLGTLTQISTIDTVATVDITSTVQDWVDGTNTNHGLRLSEASGTSVAWHSRSATTAAYLPSLAVTYTYPAMVYEVNSTAITAGIQAFWQPIPTGQNANATQKLSTNWRRHIWTSAMMEMSEWTTLIALRGTTLTELKTTKESAPNTPDTYSTAKLLTATGNHRGRQMQNVKIEFLVDITS